MPETPDPSDADRGGATPSDPGDATPSDPGDTDGATPAEPVEDERRDTDAPDREDEGEGVFGEAAPETSVEPGAPSIESTAFFLLGVATTVGLVIHLASLTG